jgi:hypothetical protein
MACNNGKTFVVSLTTIPGGTAANANYLLQLDHYTCGGKKLCSQGETYPVAVDLKATPIGQPVALPVNGTTQYCQEVLLIGTCTYMPYTCGCQCGVCPITENIYCTVCVPCSSNVTPTLTAGTAAAAPTNVQPCCNTTNCVAITCALNVATGA